MKCEYCEVLERKEEILYEDKDVVVVVKDKVLTPGQITVFPREHVTIFEQIPPDLLEKCILLANKVSMAVFAAFGSQGTNLLIQNGINGGQHVPHCGIEIIPRQENDGLALTWESKQLQEEELETTFLLLKEELASSQDKKQETKITQKAQNQKENSHNDEQTNSKTNFLTKSLRRIP